MRQILVILLASITFMGCQTMKNIVEHPDTDVLDMFRGQKTYNLNAPFPENGYKLQAVQYHNIELKKFSDNDTLYYIKYNPRREERNFYFTVIDKQTADTILANALSKTKNLSSSERRIWLYNALNNLGINNLNDNKGLWTYFAPKSKMVKGNLPTDAVRTGFHREYEQFNYSTAMTHYYEQRNPQHKMNAIEALGALYIINRLYGSNSGDNVVYCRTCGLPFSNEGELRSHENAAHDY